MNDKMNGATDMYAAVDMQKYVFEAYKKGYQGGVMACADFLQELGSSIPDDLNEVRDMHHMLAEKLVSMMDHVLADFESKMQKETEQ